MVKYVIKIMYDEKNDKGIPIGNLEYDEKNIKFTYVGEPDMQYFLSSTKELKNISALAFMGMLDKLEKDLLDVHLMGVEEVDKFIRNHKIDMIRFVRKE